MDKEKLLNHLSESPSVDRYVVSGFARLDENVKDHILFARGRSCSNWVVIPLSMIEKWTNQGFEPCQGTYYHVLRLELKKPKTTEENVYADIVASILLL